METEQEIYDRRKQEAKERYMQVGRVWCPALDTHVSFNRIGFKHLIRKHSERRTKKEQIRRFSLLAYAGSTLTAKNIHMIYRQKDERMRFWAFLGEFDGVAIKLIVRQIGDKQKHFFSIFHDKQKSTR